MSQLNCNCSCSRNKVEEPEEVIVANAMKKFGYNSVPGLQQTTQVEIGCLKDAVDGSKENTKDCLAKCNEARLGTCLPNNNVAIPQGYCFDACSGSDIEDSTRETVDPVKVFNSCSKDFVGGKCFPSDLSACIRENCGDDTNCLSTASSWVYNFCRDSNGDTAQQKLVGNDSTKNDSTVDLSQTVSGKAFFILTGLLVVSLLLMFLYKYYKRNYTTKNKHY